MKKCLLLLVSIIAFGATTMEELKLREGMSAPRFYLTDAGGRGYFVIEIFGKQKVDTRGFLGLVVCSMS